MANAVGGALERLRKSAVALNQITDVAANAVKSVEDFLEGCSLGIPEFVKVRDDENPDDSVFLEYRRIGRAFRIAIVIGVTAETESVRPWSDCSRQEKLEAFAKLPDLLNKIADTVDAQILEAKVAVAAISKSVPSLVAKEAVDDIPF